MEGDGEFAVHINEELAARYAGSADIEEFARRFAGWTASAERQFAAKDVKELLVAIDQDSATFQIIGYSEFPYSNGTKLKGCNRQIEREYWLQLVNVDQRCPTSLPGTDVSPIPSSASLSPLSLPLACPATRIPGP